jgi:hypothetical protein
VVVAIGRWVEVNLRSRWSVLGVVVCMWTARGKLQWPPEIINTGNSASELTMVNGVAPSIRSLDLPRQMGMLVISRGGHVILIWVFKFDVKRVGYIVYIFYKSCIILYLICYHTIQK